MKRKLWMGVLAALALCAIGLNPPAARAEVSSAQVSDFLAAGEGATVAGGEEDPSKTLAQLDAASSAALRYGEAEADYPADATVFEWQIEINSLSAGQSVAVSFLKDAAALPFAGAVGITYLFTATDENSLNVYVLNAADGGLVQEMIDTSSPWAYMKDGTFPDYPKGETEGYSGGKIGVLTRGGLTGGTLKVACVVDDASFGGTTFRPGISGGNTLGCTVPGETFTNRSMDAKSAVLMLSARGADGSVALTLSAPNDRATRAYRESAARTELISRVSGYVRQAEQALAGNLPAEDYFALVEGMVSADLSVLRTQDRATQQQNLDKAQNLIEELSALLANIPAGVQIYLDALAPLAEQGGVTTEAVEAALAAKSAYEAAMVYAKYLEGEALSRVEELVAGVDETLLDKGRLHLQISAYEAAVTFSEAPQSATPQQIVAANRLGEAVDRALAAALGEETLLDRLAACDNAVRLARRYRAFDVEDYRIEEYRAAAGALMSATAEGVERVYRSRPQPNYLGIAAEHQEILKERLAAADAALGERAEDVLNAWLDTYQTMTARLADLAALTQQRIEEAAAAAYEQEALSVIQGIADSLGWDLRDLLEKLSECDRAVAAAPQRLLGTVYAQLSGEDLTDVALLDAAYRAGRDALNADRERFSDQENADFDALLAAANGRYEQAALALIQPALDAFALAVEELSSPEQLAHAKAMRDAVPSLNYLIAEEDRLAAQSAYDEAERKLTGQPLYDIYVTGPSWTASAEADGIRLTNVLNDKDGCDGLACIQDPLSADGLEFAFDFTKIGRIWKGEDPAGSGKYPQSILVVNVMREKGKSKDQCQGFSVYFYCNQLDQLEVNVYGAMLDGGEVKLASGVIEGVPFTNEDAAAYTVRMRMEMMPAPLNCYKLWVNSLQLNLYYRDFINPGADSPAHLAGYEPGVEIGDKIFKDGKAYLSLIYFAADLTAAEERESVVTLRMIGQKTFGGYVPPTLTRSVELVSGPDKTVYKMGESFDKAGILLRASLTDGTEKDVPLEQIRVLGFSSNSRGTKSVTLSYTDGNGATFNKVIKVTVEGEETGGAAGGCGCGTLGLGGGGIAGGLAVLAAAGLLLAIGRRIAMRRKA